MRKKIKLVAIAKDEGAYIPDWIAHHLYFGFDEIEIYINGTTDNTGELIETLKKDEKVKFTSGDIFFSGKAHPQRTVYLHAYNETKKQNFSHLMFLDIDEFWTPLNFEDTIQDCLENIEADVISFEWYLRHSESENFSPPFLKETTGCTSNLVKSIFSLETSIQDIGVHKVIAKNAIYKLADGKKAKFISRGSLNSNCISDELKPYFVMHRMFRSQMEYVSLLTKPQATNDKYLSHFKGNRPGYCPRKDKTTFNIDDNKLENYQTYRDEFFKLYIPQGYFLRAHNFILERFTRVNQMIVNAQSYDADTLKRILLNVTVSPTAEIYTSWKNKQLSSGDVDFLKDLAISFENKNPELSYKIMSIAHKARPKGKIIQNKLNAYKKLIFNRG